MTISEQERHRFIERIGEVMGADYASVAMDLLPPAGWADLATKDDLGHLEQRTNLRFDVVDARFDALESRLMAAITSSASAQTKVFVGSTVAIVLAMFGTVVGLG